MNWRCRSGDLWDSSASTWDHELQLRMKKQLSGLWLDRDGCCGRLAGVFLTVGPNVWMRKEEWKNNPTWPLCCWLIVYEAKAQKTSDEMWTFRVILAHLASLDIKFSFLSPLQLLVLKAQSRNCTRLSLGLMDRFSNCRLRVGALNPCWVFLKERERVEVSFLSLALSWPRPPGGRSAFMLLCSEASACCCWMAAIILKAGSCCKELRRVQLRKVHFCSLHFAAFHPAGFYSSPNVPKLSELNYFINVKFFLCSVFPKKPLNELKLLLIMKTVWDNFLCILIQHFVK